MESEKTTSVRSRWNEKISCDRASEQKDRRKRLRESREEKRTEGSEGSKEFKPVSFSRQKLRYLRFLLLKLPLPGSKKDFVV